MRYYDNERLAAFERDGYRCVRCGLPATQAAHRIPRRKHLIKLYGAHALDSRDNLASACSLECNGYLQLPGYAWDEHAQRLAYCARTGIDIRT